MYLRLSLCVVQPYNHILWFPAMKNIGSCLTIWLTTHIYKYIASDKTLQAFSMSGKGQEQLNGFLLNDW